MSFNYTRFMSVRSAPYVEAIDHLPEGAILVLPQASWEQYEDLLADLVDRPGVRVSYDEGRLEVMSPSAEHEAYKDFILRIAQALSEELAVALETRGSTTWKRRTLRKGAEPDACFYVASAHRVIGKRTIDLESDPPPDIVVEIDVTTESLGKFPIYAALAVPEIWRYDGTRFQIYELTGQTYVEAAGSRFFPGVDGQMLLESLALSKTRGQTEALKAFRQRIRARRV
jgi:Uma2 family endonuclease